MRSGARRVWPTSGDLVLLADARLVREPDFYGVGLDAFFAPICARRAGRLFLKSSIAPAACA